MGLCTNEAFSLGYFAYSKWPQSPNYKSRRENANQGIFAEMSMSFLKKKNKGRTLVVLSPTTLINSTKKRENISYFDSDTQINFDQLLIYTMTTKFVNDIDLKAYIFQSL
jgi:hypothetical protein